MEDVKARAVQAISVIDDRVARLRDIQCARNTRQLRARLCFLAVVGGVCTFTPHGLSVFAIVTIGMGVGMLGRAAHTAWNRK